MAENEQIPDKLVTIAETLQQQGYYTVNISTNVITSAIFGFNQGFDEFLFLYEKNIESAHVLSDKVNKTIFRLLNEHTKTPRRKPLFMFVWVSDPHSPYTPPDYAKNLLK